MQGKKHKGVSWYQFCDGLSKRSVICNTFCDLHLGATCTSVTAGPIPPNQPPASLDLASMAITKTWRMAILGIAPPFLLLFLFHIQRPVPDALPARARLCTPHTLPLGGVWEQHSASHLAHPYMYICRLCVCVLHA